MWIFLFLKHSHWPCTKLTKKRIICFKKSRIWETLNLSTGADSSTDTKTDRNVQEDAAADCYLDPSTMSREDKKNTYYHAAISDTKLLNKRPMYFSTFP